MLRRAFDRGREILYTGRVILEKAVVVDMTGYLMRRFIRDYEDTETPQVRQQYGALSGGVGILLNLLLFLGKLAAGLLTGAISVTADAFNNLSDAASSVVTLIGFRLAGQKADAGHPFGHGRIEYLAGLIVSLLILLVGFELGKSSVEKLLHPEVVELSLLTVGILAVSVAVKLWMSVFNRKLGRAADSASLRATAADSLSDAVATSVVLLGLVVGHFTNLAIDGWAGLLVALFILRAGFGAAKDTLNPLLGQPPSPELVEGVSGVILGHSQIVGIHDLIIHDYGPGRRMMSVHAEVDARSDMLEAHDIIDHIERELGERFHLEAVIHMDPVILDDVELTRVKELAARLARQIDPRLSIHDFRLTAGPLHSNLIFDVEAPYETVYTDQQIAEKLKEKLQAADKRYFAVIQVDRQYSQGT